MAVVLRPVYDCAPGPPAGQAGGSDGLSGVDCKGQQEV